MSEPLLAIHDLQLSFPVFQGEVHALNRVSITVHRGEIVGLVGESGSGKSVTVMLAMRLLPANSYRINGGSVRLLGTGALNASEKEMRQLRGGAVYQSRYGGGFAALRSPVRDVRRSGDESGKTQQVLTQPRHPYYAIAAGFGAARRSFIRRRDSGQKRRAAGEPTAATGLLFSRPLPAGFAGLSAAAQNGRQRRRGRCWRAGVISPPAP